MTKFRKKPVVIEATQWHQHGDHPSVAEVPSSQYDFLSSEVNYRPDDYGWIYTLEGGHLVSPGDWIIKGVKGEEYPCKPDIFAATYQPAEDGPPASRVDEAAKAFVEALNERGFKFEDTTTLVEIDGGETADTVPEFLFHALCKAVRDAGI
jgi:hypothetical protein